MGGREGGRNGGRDGGREGGMEGGMEGGRNGGREGGWKGGSERGRVKEGGRKGMKEGGGGREGEKERANRNRHCNEATTTAYIAKTPSTAITNSFHHTLEITMARLAVRGRVEPSVARWAFRKSTSGTIIAWATLAVQRIPRDTDAAITAGIRGTRIDANTPFCCHKPMFTHTGVTVPAVHTCTVFRALSG